MKFKKITLEESLFDTEPSWLSSPVQSSAMSTSYDDDFVDELTDEHSIRSDMAGPSSGSDAGVADLLITAVNDEWEAIRSYNSLVETLKYESMNNPDYDSFINILNEINSEENKHVGQLQEILQKLSPNTRYIDKGREEGRSQFNFSNGQLQVQAWEVTAPRSLDTNKTQNSIDDVCTITDIDDDM